jgi:hypothetical protein
MPDSNDQQAALVHGLDGERNWASWVCRRGNRWPERGLGVGVGGDSRMRGMSPSTSQRGSFWRRGGLAPNGEEQGKCGQEEPRASVGARGEGRRSADGGRPPAMQGSMGRNSLAPNHGLGQPPTRSRCAPCSFPCVRRPAPLRAAWPAPRRRVSDRKRARPVWGSSRGLSMPVWVGSSERTGRWGRCGRKEKQMEDLVLTPSVLDVGLQMPYMRIQR